LLLRAEGFWEDFLAVEYSELHSWPASRSEAYAIQEKLAAEVDLHGGSGDHKLISAVDTAYGHGGSVLYACAVTVTFPEIEEVERVFYHGKLQFPYVPGLLYFREGPIIVKALAELKSDPDLIIVHGHGIAHPKRCGMATHIGLVFDRPTIGCARRLLAGSHRPVPPAKGSYQPIFLRSKEVGVAYRSKDNVKPIFISPGHRCDLAEAKDMVLRNLRGFRQPEPLRLAHLFVNKYKRHMEKEKADQPETVEGAV